jgi:hypothetical protein
MEEKIPVRNVLTMSGAASALPHLTSWSAEGLHLTQFVLPRCKMIKAILKNSYTEINLSQINTISVDLKKH